jgi:ribose 5-phosphate isomerase B
MVIMHIALASDHAALELKAALVQYLTEIGHQPVDLGPFEPHSVDYPDYGYRLARAIAAGEAERGVALCGSGIGISIAVNRHPQARCALVSDMLSAALAREHNDANIIAMGARLIGVEQAKACLATFIETPFARGRHQRRVDQLGTPQFDRERQSA